MSNKIKGIFVGIIIGVIISATTTFALNGSIQKILEYRDIKIYVDGNKITPTDADDNYVEPFIIDGTTYLPVRAVANALEKDVSWDGNTHTVYIGKKPDADYISAFAENIKSVIGEYGRYVDTQGMGIRGLKYGGLVDFEKDGIPELVLCHDMIVKVYRFDGEKSTMIYNKNLGARYMQTDVSPTFTVRTAGDEPILMTYHSTKEWCEEAIDVFSVKNGQPNVTHLFAHNTDGDGEVDFNEFMIDDTTVSMSAYNGIRDSIFAGAMHVDALWNSDYYSDGMINATESELNTFLIQFGI